MVSHLDGTEQGGDLHCLVIRLADCIKDPQSLGYHTRDRVRCRIYPRVLNCPCQRPAVCHGKGRPRSEATWFWPSMSALPIFVGIMSRSHTSRWMARITDKNELVPGNKTVHRRPSIGGKLGPVALGDLVEDLDQPWVAILVGVIHVSIQSRRDPIMPCPWWTNFRGKLTLNREKTLALLTRRPQLTVSPGTGGSLNTRAVNSMSVRLDKSASTGDNQSDLALPYHQLVLVRGKSGMCFSLSAGTKQRQPTWSVMEHVRNWQNPERWDGPRTCVVQRVVRSHVFPHDLPQQYESNDPITRLNTREGNHRPTYRTDPISPHNQIHNSLRPVLERNPHALLAEILQANEFLVELDQLTRGFVGQRLLQDKTLHPACPIRITRVVGDPGINNLACVGIPGMRLVMLDATVGTEPGSRAGVHDQRTHLCTVGFVEAPFTRSRMPSSSKTFQPLRLTLIPAPRFFSSPAFS